jgi:2-hydroxy-6-oxonona-2,4-dienedioate hydrolase
MNEERYREAETKLWNSVGLSPTDKRVHLEHGDVDVRVQEVGEGPPVLFIHGASNSGTSWAGLIARLPEFRSLILDRPGCGLSDPLGMIFEDAASLASFSDTLVTDVLDALDLESAHLVATSYGGYAALRAAAAHPGRVERMVIFGWTMGAANPRLPAFMRFVSIPSIGRLFTRLPVNEQAVRMMFKRIGLRQALEAGRVPQEVIDCYVALLRHTDTMRNELEVGRWTMTRKGLAEGIVLPPTLLSKIQAPTYFLWGDEDPFGSPDVARDLVKHIPNAELEILPGTGHAVWLDDPDHAANVTTSFLTK